MSPRPQGVECDAVTHSSAIRFEHPTPFGAFHVLIFCGTPAIVHVDRDGYIKDGNKGVALPK